MTGIAQRVIDRLEHDASTETKRKLLTAAYVLSGLRIKRDEAQTIFAKGISEMRESDTYMAIIDEGREAEARRLLTLAGTKHCGPPSEANTLRLQGITDIERMERMILHAPDASGWEELLAVS